MWVCGLLRIAVSSYRYRSRRSNEWLREKLVRLTREKPRYGYRRLQVLVEREGERVNHKRLSRVDAQTNKLITSIPLGGGAGNTFYDSGSGHILVAVHRVNELVEIDPAAMKIVGRYKLPGIENPHGIALDIAHRLAFIAGEENHSLAVFDLKTMKLISVHQVGEDPDVLAFDAGLGRLYVSAESGTVTVLQRTNGDLQSLGQFRMPHAHTVSVDPNSHLVYFPLENIGGRPLLKIMRPADK